MLRTYCCKDKLKEPSSNTDADIKKKNSDDEISPRFRILQYNVNNKGPSKRRVPVIFLLVFFVQHFVLTKFATVNQHKG